MIKRKFFGLVPALLSLLIVFGVCSDQRVSAAQNNYSERKLNYYIGTSNTGTSRWADVSGVQQFSYMDEGLAYAYMENGKLYIVTPGNEIIIKKTYPKLGDVISDNDGNFYVIWGKDNETDDASVNTVFITKYNSKGKKVKETGFVGKSSPWGDDDSAKTKSPFVAGSCKSAIYGNILVCYHAKKRYDGHQSDQVIVVEINSMKPYDIKNNCYAGHSFNQDVIYSDKIGDFVFADLGDCYSRGFRVNRINGYYGVDSEIVFHTYLKANAGYDMWIVNETFAQLGGIVQTSDENIMLCGASVKSLSSKAEKQKQNLFVQIINPAATEVNKKMFVGGKTRKGKTAISMYDTKTTSVSDYGVIWLTGYKDRDVITPQLVSAGDKIVIMWNENKDYKTETCYMVLSSKGEILTKKTSLKESCLNSYEKPVYFKGKVYWAYADYEKIRVKSIDL